MSHVPAYTETTTRNRVRFYRMRCANCRHATAWSMLLSAATMAHRDHADAHTTTTAAA